MMNIEKYYRTVCWGGTAAAEGLRRAHCVAGMRVRSGLGREPRPTTLFAVISTCAFTASRFYPPTLIDVHLEVACFLEWYLLTQLAQLVFSPMRYQEARWRAAAG